jgi:hypothetical protein
VVLYGRSSACRQGQLRTLPTAARVARGSCGPCPQQRVSPGAAADLAHSGACRQGQLRTLPTAEVPRQEAFQASRKGAAQTRPTGSRPAAGRGRRDQTTQA